MARRPRQPGDPRVAIGYLRVSTDKQHLGPDAQKHAIEQWAANNGVAIAAWHTDYDVSGGSELAARPGMIAAIRNLRAQNAGILAVARRDRLARSVEVAVALEREIGRAGAIVASADGRNDDGPSGTLIRQIEDALAEHERALISQRTKAALDVLRRRGRATSKPPFGFRVSGGPRSRAGRPTRLVPDDREQEVCSIVMRLHESGRTAREIEDTLRWTVKDRVGQRLDQNQIRRIIRRCPVLRNFVYPNHARGLGPPRIACERGHLYGEAMIGKYCVRGACKDGRGDASDARRIDFR